MHWMIIPNIIRSLFAAIDKIVAWAIEESYVMIVQLANIRIFGKDVLETFANRINILLGLIMLFWLAFRIVKYVINPDMINDQQQGFSKIIMNVLVMLFMLVFVNFGFNAMYKVQNMIFESDILPNLIFGTANNEYTGKNIDSAHQTGKKIAFYIYTAFVYPSHGSDSPMANYCENFYGLTPDELRTCYSNIGGNSTPEMANRLASGIEMHDYNVLLSGEILTARKGTKYIMNYTFIISTICGAIALIILVQIAIDVAIRIAKLGLLQLIAPIPIISYVDPSSGKNGIFHKWLVEVGKTFASVFIKIGALYFTVFIIMMAISSNAYSSADVAGLTAGDPITLGKHPLLVVMIIIGALLFAKELPKLISQMFGVNLDGNSMGFAKRAGAGALAAAGGFAAGASAAGRGADWSKGNKLKSLGSTLGRGMTGALGAGGRGLLYGAKGQGITKNAGAAIHKNNIARNANDAYKEDGIKGLEMLKTRATDQINEWTGYQNAAGESNSMESRIKELNKEIENNIADENSLRMQAAKVVNDSGFTGDKLLKMDKTYKKYLNDSDFAAKTLLPHLQSGDLSLDEYKKHMEKWEKDYKSSHEGIEEAEKNSVIADKYSRINAEIKRLDEDTYNKRNRVEKYQRALNERNKKK